MSCRKTVVAAGKTTELWVAARVDSENRTIYVQQDADEEGPGKPWYASAPNGDTDSYGLLDHYQAVDDDPAVAVAKVLVMLAEDLPDWVEATASPSSEPRSQR